MLLDAELIRSLRHSRGYSQRQTADHLGVSIGVVRSLEEGINHDELPLRMIARIADLFGVPTTTLFTTPTSTDQAPAALTAEIGAVLLTVEEPVTLTALAEICRSDLTSVRTALEELKAVYAQTGGAIAESDEGIQLMSRQDSVDVDVVSRTIKWIHARQGLSPTEARLLDEHRRGVLSTQNFNADEHIAYARLINAGLVIPTASNVQPD